ncbi:MAG: UDP-N-acetylglucosamine 2-epimerase (non-hydrolyzing), partial [Chloroflexota bacterium]
MDKLKVLTVVGARPNFMKAAPIVSEMKKRSNLEPLLLHTGQHYDDEMSKVFFSDLKLPKPDAYLGVGGGSHAEQIAKTMIGVESFLKQVQPHLVVLVGDVNSTLACAIVASKMHIPIAHVEAGLRSFDRTMPEEINRIATDALSDLLFITEKSAYKNLKREGIPNEKIFFVGNVMIDTLYAFVEEARKRPTLDELGLTRKE